MSLYQTVSNEPMSAMQAATTKKDYTFSPPSDIRSQIRSTRGSFSLKSLLKEPLDPPLSAGLDFLLQMHVRRENTDSRAQSMTRTERTMILKGARKERTMMLEDALKMIDAQ
jgi:hypothetical protein